MVEIIIKQTYFFFIFKLESVCSSFFLFVLVCGLILVKHPTVLQSLLVLSL